jgi:tRNA(adenine34) deaminase
VPPGALDPSNEPLMERALALATRGLEEGELPIGAVVAVDGEVIAEAYWRGGTEPGWLRHPELVALLAADEVAGRDRRRAVLCTTLEPCLMCMGAAMSFFLAKVVYALPSPTDGAASVAAQWAPGRGHPLAGSAAPYRVPEVLGGIGRERSAALVRAFLDRGAAGPLADWARSLV